MDIKLLTLDCSKYRLYECFRKITEEHKEFQDAEPLEDVIDEILDVMQSCKTTLEKLAETFGVECVNEGMARHEAKLRQRAADGKIRLIEDGGGRDE